MSKELSELFKNLTESINCYREQLKKLVQEKIDKRELNYAEAIIIFEDSKIFEIKGYIIDSPLLEYFYDSGYCCDRYRTIYFSTVCKWIEDEKEELLKTLNYSNDDELYKELYDIVISTNYIGFEYDW